MKSKFGTLKRITTIPEYCKEINIPPPKYPFFDVRRFEDKVKTENSKQAPIRHEFYAIALRHVGDNREVNGEALRGNLFFNSPYQIISWDVLPNWKGWYIMFGLDFLASNPAWKNLLVNYPFFRLDKSIPFNLPAPDVALANNLFQQIFEEYHSERKDSFNFIRSYTSLLMLLTKRYYDQSDPSGQGTHHNRSADIILVSRFQTLVETCIMDEHGGAETRRPAFYAGRLNVHTNHLNAMVKRITGRTATGIIQDCIITFAKTLLQHYEIPAKEVAFRLQFSEPAHFSSFFKKLTGFTPKQFRENHNL